MVHQLGAAAVSCDGQAAADNFAQRGEIAFDLENLLRGAVVQTKAGDDFVDDQQRAIRFRDVAQAGQKARGGWDHAHVGGDRLNNDGGDFVPVLREDSVDRGQIMVASVPLDTNRIFSMNGIARVINVASSTSSSVVTPKLVPRFACSAMAALMAGFAWPNRIAPQEQTETRSWLPSAS